MQPLWWREDAPRLLQEVGGLPRGLALQRSAWGSWPPCPSNCRMAVATVTLRGTCNLQLRVMLPGRGRGTSLEHGGGEWVLGLAGWGPQGGWQVGGQSSGSGGTMGWPGSLGGGEATAAVLQTQGSGLVGAARQVGWVTLQETLSETW